MKENPGAAFDRPGIGARHHVPACLPVKRLHPHLKTGLQRVIGKRRLRGRSPHSLQGARHRVHPERGGDVIHDRCDAIDPMGFRRRTEIARGGALGLHRRERTRPMGAGIPLQATDAPGILAIGAHATGAEELDGGDRAIVCDPHLATVARWASAHACRASRRGACMPA